MAHSIESAGSWVVGSGDFAVTFWNVHDGTSAGNASPGWARTNNLCESWNQGFCIVICHWRTCRRKHDTRAGVSASKQVKRGDDRKPAQQTLKSLQLLRRFSRGVFRGPGPLRVGPLWMWKNVVIIVKVKNFWKCTPEMYPWVPPFQISNYATAAQDLQ